eukprot:4649575-Prymnesium_polylepis.1
MSIRPCASMALVGIVRKKVGYFSPSLSSGVVAPPETIGTLAIDAIWAANRVGPEQSAPTIALTPSPLK